MKHQHWTIRHPVSAVNGHVSPLFQQTWNQISLEPGTTSIFDPDPFNHDQGPCDQTSFSAVLKETWTQKALASNSDKNSGSNGTLKSQTTKPGDLKAESVKTAHLIAQQEGVPQA